MSKGMTLYKIGSRGVAVRQIQRALHLQADGIYGVLTREAVADFQRRNGLTPDGIVGPATLMQLIPLRLKKSQRTINEIIVHCTATGEGRDYDVATIRSWHIRQGWSDIGYHYLIRLDGTIETGRDVNIAGAHCQGHNTHSIGVCYVGGVTADYDTPKDTRTEAQKDALVQLLVHLRALYPKATIHGHRDFAAKACPSFDARKEYESL